MGIKLKDWLKTDPSDEELSEIFYNMSKTLKYIHNRGYCVQTFNLNEIEIFDTEKLYPIQFNKLNYISDDSYHNRTFYDNYNLTFMQIGIYTDLLDNLRPDFLKKEFESFIPLLPEKDIFYYRSIILRNSNVYYSDFIDEKNKRELSTYQQFNEGESNMSTVRKGQVQAKQKVKATSIGKAFADLYNNNDAAFATLLLFPLLVVVIGFVISLVLIFTT